MSEIEPAASADEMEAEAAGLLRAAFHAYLDEGRDTDAERVISALGALEGDQ